MMTIMEAVVEETAVWAVVAAVVEGVVEAAVDAAVVDAALLAPGDHGRGALEVDRLGHFIISEVY